MRLPRRDTLRHHTRSGTTHAHTSSEILARAPAHHEPAAVLTWLEVMPELPLEGHDEAAFLVNLCVRRVHTRARARVHAFGQSSSRGEKPHLTSARHEQPRESEGRRRRAGSAP